MFERAYALRSFTLTPHATDQINEAVMRFDLPDAAAGVACMSVSNGFIYILIEYWRSAINGHPEQTPEGSMDGRTASARPPRRSRATRADDTGTAQRDQPEGQPQPVEPPGQPRGGSGQDDRELSGAEGVTVMDTPPASPTSPASHHPRSCSIHKSNLPSDCDCGRRA